MTKVLLTLLTLAMATDASAQQRTYYDGSGKVVGRSSTDTQGSTTVYDASGNIIGRESKTGNQTTIYDAAGCNVGAGSPRTASYDDLRPKISFVGVRAAFRHFGTPSRQAEAS